jgi:nuclear transport factor 2 (NTF2) superfamily protein
MKLLTSFTKLTTGEGVRVSYTYSEVDDNGNLISQNNRENFIVIDNGLLEHISAIENYIKNNKLSN